MQYSRFAIRVSFSRECTPERLRRNATVRSRVVVDCPPIDGRNSERVAMLVAVFFFFSLFVKDQWVLTSTPERFYPRFDTNTVLHGEKSGVE